jgi:hypothetical protein
MLGARSSTFNRGRPGQGPLERLAVATVFEVRDEIWEVVEPMIPPVKVPERGHLPSELGCSGVTAWRRLRDLTVRIYTFGVRRGPASPTATPAGRCAGRGHASCARGSPGCAQHVRHRSSMLGHGLQRGDSVRSRLPIGLDHGCAAKTWATAPPLKAMVLIGSMVSGAMKIRSPAPRTTGWMTRRYSSIKPVSTSDRANRAPP